MFVYTIVLPTKKVQVIGYKRLIHKVLCYQKQGIVEIKVYGKIQK